MNFQVIKNRTFGSSDQLLMNNICFVDSEIVLKVILMHVIIVLMYNICMYFEHMYSGIRADNREVWPSYRWLL